MRVRWDPNRERLLAAGMDSQLKFFSYEEKILKLAYKIRAPQEITSLDISVDGVHFAMGLSTGSLIIKSKALESENELENEEQ